MTHSQSRFIAVSCYSAQGRETRIRSANFGEVAKPSVDDVPLKRKLPLRFLDDVQGKLGSGVFGPGGCIR